MQRHVTTEARPAFSEFAQVEMTEREAIKRAQAGESAAFEYLYRSHSRRVYALCLRMVGNATDAEDLTQEAFLQVFRKIHTFRGDSAFSTWLHRLSVNIVLMRLRRKTVSESPLEDTFGEDEARQRPKEIGGPDLVLAGSIDRLHIQRAIAQLPPGYKQIFVLHDVLGYEHNEIAARLNCSVGNSKSQLHKARTRLRKLLREADRESQREVRSRTIPSGPERDPHTALAEASISAGDVTKFSLCSAVSI